MISGAAIAIAALLLIVPGFATDIFGFLLIFPLSRKFLFKILEKKINYNKKENKNYIDGEFEDIEEDNDRKI